MNEDKPTDLDLVDDELSQSPTNDINESDEPNQTNQSTDFIPKKEDLPKAIESGFVNVFKLFAFIIVGIIVIIIFWSKIDAFLFKVFYKNGSTCGCGYIPSTYSQCLECEREIDQRNRKIEQTQEYKDCIKEGNDDWLCSSTNSEFPIMVGKPLIYLYPTKPTRVSVSVDKPNNLTTTYPKYNNDWTVLAQPNGNLKQINDSRTYYGLYWEGKNGIKTEFYDGFGPCTIFCVKFKSIN